MMRTLLVIWLLAVPALVGQDRLEAPFEQIAKLARARSMPPTETFDKESFKPETVFRGKTLLQWLEALRDADTEGTAQPASEVWLAMGSRAVPFLVAAQGALDWSEVNLSFQPNAILAEMGDAAIPGLVRLLGSENTLGAWHALTRVISRKAGIPGGPAPSADQQKRIDEHFGPLVDHLSRCLGSSDAATRLASLSLLRDVAMMTRVSSKVLSGLPVGARRLLDKDPRNEVRGAACELLVFLGLRSVTGGLTHDELKKMVHPNGNTSEVDTTLPPEVARAVAMGILFHMQREMQKPAAPTAK